MSLTQINLKPYWDENTIERMDVTIKITGLSYKEGERLCSMQLSTVTIPGCEPNALQICDESGAVLVKESEETPYPYHWRRWNVQRGTEGNVSQQIFAVHILTFVQKREVQTVQAFLF